MQVIGRGGAAGGGPRFADVAGRIPHGWGGVPHRPGRIPRSWRSIPRDFPNWGTVRHYYDRFRDDGTWHVVHERLREQVRWKAGKTGEPSAAVIDSQSVKTTEKGGPTGTTPARR